MKEKKTSKQEKKSKNETERINKINLFPAPSRAHLQQVVCTHPSALAFEPWVITKYPPLQQILQSLRRANLGRHHLYSPRIIDDRHAAREPARKGKNPTGGSPQVRHLADASTGTRTFHSPARRAQRQCYLGETVYRVEIGCPPWIWTGIILCGCRYFRREVSLIARIRVHRLVLHLHIAEAARTTKIANYSSWVVEKESAFPRIRILLGLVFDAISQAMEQLPHTHLAQNAQNLMEALHPPTLEPLQAPGHSALFRFVSSNPSDNPIVGKVVP